MLIAYARWCSDNWGSPGFYFTAREARGITVIFIPNLCKVIVSPKPFCAEETGEGTARKTLNRMWTNDALSTTRPRGLVENFELLPATSTSRGIYVEVLPYCESNLDRLVSPVGYQAQGIASFCNIHGFFFGTCNDRRSAFRFSLETSLPSDRTSRGPEPQSQFFFRKPMMIPQGKTATVGQSRQRPISTGTCKWVWFGGKKES
jgi:hypothetical protein